MWVPAWAPSIEPGPPLIHPPCRGPLASPAGAGHPVGGQEFAWKETEGGSEGLPPASRARGFSLPQEPLPRPSRPGHLQKGQREPLSQGSLTRTHTRGGRRAHWKILPVTFPPQ